MASQDTLDKIIKGKDNPVVLVFSGVDLTGFTKIIAAFKTDIRNSVDHPDDVKVVSATELELNFQDTTETGSAYWTITGESVTYPNGFDLTSGCMCNLGRTTVCD